MKTKIVISILLLLFTVTAAARSKLYRMYYSTGYQGGFEMGTFDRQQGNACDPERYANGFRIKGRKFMLEQKHNIGYEDEDIINGLMDGYYAGYKDSCKSYSKNYNYEIVVKLQKRLTDEGYSPGKIDGIWGRKTENALKEFQKKNKLKITGTLTSETMKYIGIEKRVEIDKTKLRKIEKKIYDYLDYTWEMKAVIIRGNIMEVIPNFNSIKKVNYTDIMPWVCREISKFPEILKDLKEIRLLNNTRKQGWVLIEPNNCYQIIHAPLNKVDKMILDNSCKY